MSLDERLRHLEQKDINKNFHVIVLHPHLTKAECIKEFEEGNQELYSKYSFASGVKVNPGDPVYWINLLPDYFQYEQIEWMKQHQKKIDDLIHNHNYSLNRIYNEFYENGF